MDLGAGRRGVDMGPSALRIARLQEELLGLGHQVTDVGNVDVPGREVRPMGDSHARFVDEIATACSALRDEVHDALTHGQTPVVLGGDHSIAVGTMAGLNRWAATQAGDFGLLWFDAHGDINTPESSPSGNVHGMPLAVCLGKGADELLAVGDARPMVAVDKCVLVGIRELDDGERAMIRDTGLKVFTMRNIDERGMFSVMEEAIDLVSGGTLGFHVSFDMDFMDPDHAPGVGTRVRGGATFREAHLAMEMVSSSGGMVSVELTEVNPVLDHRNETANLAVDLLASAFGKTIR